MRIALLAPCEESVPPAKYGGIERCVYYLGLGLQAQGHEVTLFGSGDSHAPFELIACSPRAIRKESDIGQLDVRLGRRYQALIRAIIHLQGRQFDIVHNHVSWPLFFFKDLIPQPIITTLHNSLLPPARHSLANDSYCANFADMPYVSISNNQRKHQPDLNYVATIHHGIDVPSFTFNAKSKDYLAFLGSFTPDKGAEHAIAIAKATGKRLVIAAKQDPFHMPYFNSKIKPHIDGKQISYIGEVDQAGKVGLLKDALAMLSPIQWDEPFGLVTIESLACGTPVIALGKGALPEVLIDGKTGYVCKTVKQMIECVDQLHRIDRAACRKHAEQNYGLERMTAQYLAAYQTVLAKYPKYNKQPITKKGTGRLLVPRRESI